MIDPFAGWQIFDVTVPLAPGIPVWPGDLEMSAEPASQTANGDGFNMTTLRMSGHVGTHVDAPRHIVHQGTTLDQIPIERWYGPCQVVEIPDDRTAIDVDDLERAGILADTSRLLFKTSNSKRWRSYPMPFEEDYVAVTPAGARWIVERGLQLVGIDYLSIEGWVDTANETHRTLLNAGVLIIENLNLSAIEPGECYLVCLPLNLTGADGSPARALLAKPPRLAMP
jgi:arylformamidase